MTWEDYGIHTLCQGCNEYIFLKSNVSIRCAECTQSMSEYSSVDYRKETLISPVNVQPISCSPGSSYFMDLCPDCFAARMEIGSHKPYHDYQFINGGAFQVPLNKFTELCGYSEKSSIVSSDLSLNEALIGTWTAREYLFLLSAIEKHGFGNWEQIAKTVNYEMNLGEIEHPKYKTPVDVKEEYMHTFLDGKLGEWWLRNSKMNSKARPKNNATEQDQIETSVLVCNREENKAPEYWPLREEFRVEFDDGAESIISQLNNETLPSRSSNVRAVKTKNIFYALNSTGKFSSKTVSPQDDIDNLDTELKIAHIEMYNMKLRERKRRHKIAQVHDLFVKYSQVHHYDKDENYISSNTLSSSYKHNLAVTEDTTELKNKLKFLANFVESSDFLQIATNISREKQLKIRIKRLVRYRRSGIKRLSEGLQYEALRKNRKLDYQARGKIRSCSMMTPFPHDSGSIYSPVATMEDLCTRYAIPGLELLSSSEKHLCNNLKISPADYLTYKTSILTHRTKISQDMKNYTLSTESKIGNEEMIFKFLKQAGLIMAA